MSLPHFNYTRTLGSQQSHHNLSFYLSHSTHTVVWKNSNTNTTASRLITEHILYLEYIPLGMGSLTTVLYVTELVDLFVVIPPIGHIVKFICLILLLLFCDFFFKVFCHPGWCDAVDCATDCEARSCQFYSQSGHMPVFQAQSPLGGTPEATTRWCFSPSLSPSLPLPQKINK